MFILTCLIIGPSSRDHKKKCYNHDVGAQSKLSQFADEAEIILNIGKQLHFSLSIRIITENKNNYSYERKLWICNKRKLPNKKGEHI